MPLAGVSFVVPLRNGAPFIVETLRSILAQADGRPFEVVIVDDGSDDGSLELVKCLVTPAVRIVAGPRRGAAAAINVGVRAARHPIVCQVDQDVVVGPGWMLALVAELADESVAAAQGHYVTDRSAPLLSRVMGLDLEDRYATLGGGTDHVCTGNAAYRAEALRRVGLFDESLGYGYDNDMSYRLAGAGYRLRYCRAAMSLHHWRESLRGYLVQQYGFGYGRIDLVAKHPHRAGGDMVSPGPMMSHPALTLAALIGLVAAPIAASMGLTSQPFVAAAVALLMGLAGERTIAGFRAARRFHDRAAWLFPVVHFMRDVAWTTAALVWVIRRLQRRGSMPADSMRPRRAPVVFCQVSCQVSDTVSDTWQKIALIPAHNEAANLQAVLTDIAIHHPSLDVLVIDDGSTDETPEVLERAGVRWIRFSERMGIGNAMRAGLRYASRVGFDVAVRMDGDGQHGACDIDALLAPIHAGSSEVVLGTRYARGRAWLAPGTSVVRRMLAVCLTAITGRRVTDPTSGFCAFGPRAVRLLAEHHPTGYAEPELRLFLSRNGIRVAEVSVSDRSRLNGKTSLTPARMLLASARVLLAMLIVPLRPAVGDAAGD